MSEEPWLYVANGECAMGAASKLPSPTRVIKVYNF